MFKNVHGLFIFSLSVSLIRSCFRLHLPQIYLGSCRFRILTLDRELIMQTCGISMKDLPKIPKMSIVVYSNIDYRY